MAKKSEKVTAEVNRELLAAIASGAVAFATKDEAIAAGIAHAPPFIEANIQMLDPANPSKAMVRITEAGAAFLTAQVNPLNEAPSQAAAGFAIITDAVLPPSKRGSGLHGGAPKKYPFDDLPVGGSFFVAVSAKLPDPVKTLGSTVSSANMRFADKVGEKTVTRAKRGKGNKLELDAAGNKIMETKQVPEYKLTRKFEIRGVTAGTKYGTWEAPANGALIGRVQ